MTKGNINLTIEPRDKIAFVDESWYSKSTFTQLIERFYDVSNGEILINGINIQNHNLSKNTGLFSKTHWFLTEIIMKIFHMEN